RVAPDSRLLLQRLHPRHRIRAPVFLASPGHVEHGQADGPVATDDACGRRPLPARSPGDPAAETSLQGHARKNCGRKVIATTNTPGATRRALGGSGLTTRLPSDAVQI